VRRVLQLLGASALRSRLGVALGLVLVIFGVVAVARIASGPEDPSAGAYIAAETSPPATNTDPGQGDDGVSDPGSESTSAVDAEPSLSPGAARPEKVAEAFAKNWLDRKASAGAWYAALQPRTTPELAAKLKGVDPLVVPATELIGPPTLVPRGNGLIEISYPVDSGTLLLRMVVTDGRWLVDGVDWERG
jgi:hypothetical protein